jgi:hypothetical protein
MTGMQGSAVLDGLRSLERAGLVRKVPGDQYRPNQLGLIFEDCFSPSGSDRRGGESPPGELETGGRSDAGSADVAAGPGANPAPKKEVFETRVFKKENSLSNLSEPLRSYFASVRPKGKRETEWEAFEGLKADYTEAQISECLLHVRERGVLGSGDPCHSPMAYLSRAMAEVMAKVGQEREKRERADATARAAAEAERARMEQEKREADEADAGLRAFETAFPDASEREATILRYAAGFPFLSPTNPITTSLAIGAWWAETHHVSNSTL